MRTKLQLVLIGFLMVALAEAQTTTTIFHDNFDGMAPRSDLWHIPTWVSSSDGTFLGRTQFRCSQNATLPAISNGETSINLDTFNSTGNPAGRYFYGTDLITNRLFTIGKGLIITVRARFKSPMPRGIVGGIFLYKLIALPSIHDEVDFELVSNRPSEVQTNIYDNEPLGAGHPAFHPITGSVTDYHTYVIKWLPGEISWLVDGITVRTTKTIIPDRPMYFHLNLWAPEKEWAEGYDSDLQWVSDPALNQTYSMIVDFVKVDSLIFPNSVSEIDRRELKPVFYPNPAHDLIFFDTPGKFSLNIYNINGELVLSRQDINDCSLSVSGLAPGFYSLQYGQNDIWRSSKMIKY